MSNSWELPYIDPSQFYMPALSSYGYPRVAPAESAGEAVRKTLESLLAEQQQMLFARQAALHHDRAVPILAPHALPVALHQSTLAALQAFIQRIIAPVRQLWTDLQRSVASVVQRAAHLNYQSVLDGVYRVADVLTEVAGVIDARGRRAIRENGFAFVLESFDTRVVWRYSFMQPGVRAAALTNRALGQIRSAAFQQDMQQAIATSPALRPRWPIVEQGLSAHLRREYFSAIATLLSVLEGMIGDLLVLRRLAEPQGHKLYEPGGKKEIRGAGVAVAKLRSANAFTPNSDEARGAEYLVDVLIDRRNGILHGRDVAYGQARLSAQVILLVRLFAGAVRLAEGLPPPA